MNYKNYLPIIGIAIFIYLLLKIGISKIFNSIIKADISFLIIACFLTLVLFFFQTLKWHLIARKQKIPINFKDSFKINLIGNFYGFVTPSKLGTIIRAEYLKKYTGGIGKGLSNFFLDKILDFCSLFFLLLVFSFILGEKLVQVSILYFLVPFFIFALMLVIFINKKIATFPLRLFYKTLLPKKLKKKAKLTFDSFYEDMPTKKRNILFFFLINVITWIITYLATFFVGLSVGINLNFLHYLAIIPIGTIISFIPITINGLGTREATLISLFSLFGIEATKVFSMSILTLIITGAIPALIASFLILKKREY